MMFNQYPYLNLNDLNLDYILAQIKIMMNEVTNFVSINAIKYADPIQWDITRQYEKNTVVIDPVTGTAYISVAPVPAGVALTRPEYWTVVFDLGSFVTRAAKNFSNRYESETTLTATFNTAMGEWLVWGDTLYKALVNITAGDSYVVDGNIQHITIEDVYNEYLNTIAAILAMIGDLQDLTTSDTSDIVHAINSVLSDLNLTIDDLILKIGDLDNLNTTDKDSIVDAINEVLQDVGDLDDLNTTDKDSIVDAINEVDGVVDNVRNDGLFYQNATRHGISLQTTWTREYGNVKATSFAVYENILAVLFDDNSLEIYNLAVTPWVLQNTITTDGSIVALAIDNNYIYALTSASIIKYNYNLAVVDSVAVTSDYYTRIRLWDDNLYLLRKNSSTVDVFDLSLTMIDTVAYTGQHANTMFAISTNFAIFGLMGNRSNHVYNNSHPERYEWVFTYPIYSNTQNPIPNTFDVCARSNSTFWILSNNISAHHNKNLLTLSQFDLIFAWDGAQYDNANNPIVNLTQYITPELKNQIQKISGSRNTPYSDFEHAQDEIGLCPKLYSMLYASNNNNDFPELYLENIAIPIRIAIDAQHSGQPNFAGIYINNCNHVEIVGVKCTGKVSENYTGSIFIRNSKVLLDNVTIVKDDAPQDIQAREGSTVYCFNCSPAYGTMVTNTRLSTIEQYPH